MKATKEEMDKRDQEYAEQFNKADEAPRQISDDEAFGLTEPPAEAGETAPAEASADAGGETAPEGSPAEEAAESPAEEAAEQAPGGEDAAPGEPPAGEAAPSPADQEQRLKSWEGRLKARQAELDAREAAMGDSSVNDTQQSMNLDDPDGDGDNDSGTGGDSDGDAGGDPAAVLAADFGQDFVQQLTALIKQVAGDGAGSAADPRVDQLIAALQNDRMQNHFNTIAASHSDFMDVVESPAFEAWKAAQPDQAKLAEVIDHGSARQIIDMLTKFKNDSKGDSPAGDDDQLDAAEGVRSSGLSLPKEPVPDDDFARAWNEA